MTTTGRGCPGSTCPDDRPGCSAGPTESLPPTPGVAPAGTRGGSLPGTQGFRCCQQGGLPRCCLPHMQGDLTQALTSSTQADMMSQDRHKWTHTPSQTLRPTTSRLSHHAGCAGHSDLQTLSHTDPRLCVPRGCPSVCLSVTHRYTHAPGLSKGPGSLFPAPAMDLLARALDCRILAGRAFLLWAWRWVLPCHCGPSGPTTCLTSHKCVWCDNRAP